MNSTLIAVIGVACIFGGTLLGLTLQRFLPVHHLSKESHEIVKLGAGMIATLTALVLGLLVSSAKGTFDTLSTGIKQSGAKLILLDRVLAQYGSETAPIREQLRLAIAARVAEIWPHQGDMQAVDRSRIERGGGIEILQSQLLQLAPKTDSQTYVLGQARQLVADLLGTRWLLIEESQNQLPIPFLVVVLFWLTVLFASFGLFAPRNVTVMAVLFVCACSVSAAIFLILEMNQPLTGTLKVSNAPMLKALELMGR
jgi:hypothetical protein